MSLKNEIISRQLTSGYISVGDAAAGQSKEDASKLLEMFQKAISKIFPTAQLVIDSTNRAQNTVRIYDSKNNIGTLTGNDIATLSKNFPGIIIHSSTRHGPVGSEFDVPYDALRRTEPDPSPDHLISDYSGHPTSLMDRTYTLITLAIVLYIIYSLGTDLKVFLGM